MLRETTPLDDEQEAAPQFRRPAGPENDPRQAKAVKLARGLGWFSLALGVTEILAPRLIARATGVRGNAALIRAAGLREIISGIGLLTAHRQGPWIWARVAGDAFDIATLGRAANVTPRPDAIKMAVAFSQIAAITALDIHAARLLTASTDGARHDDVNTSPMRDYSERRGFSHPPEQMRGAALSDFEMPRDMVTPPALQSYLRSPAASQPTAQ